MFFQTGIDKGSSGIKKVTLFVLPFVSYYRIVSPFFSGKQIYVIPSHQVLLKTLPKEITNIEEAKKYVKEEILSFIKGREVLWKIWWEKDRAKVLLAEPEGKIKKGFFWDAEPIALARAFLTTGLENGTILDFGQTKTTLVSIKNRHIQSFRCFLNGLEEFDKKFDLETYQGPFVLSGGNSLSPKIREYFKEKEVKRIKGVSPEKVSAFGAALWGVIGRHFPSFYSYFGIDSKKAIQIEKLLLGGIALCSVCWLGLKLGVPKLQQKIILQEKALFKQYYPEIPPVSPLKQVKIMIKEYSSPKFEHLLKNALENLPSQARILEIIFKDNVLKLKLELPEDKAKNLPGKLSEMKKLPGGSVIIVLEFNHEKS